MDLKSVAAVIGRHRIAMTIGILVAFALAFLAAFRLDTSSIPPPRRQATTFESTARLFVTQEGFPWGRSALRYTTKPDQPPVVEGDPDRFASLALLYSQLANTNRIQGRLAKEDRGAVVAKVVTESQYSSTPIPMIDIAAKATTPAHARALARTVTSSLVGFIERNQAQSKIPPDERVVLQVIDPARLGIVVSSPSPALPALVLLTMLLLTVGGIFVLDNWRRGPTIQVVENEEASEEDTLRRIAPAPAAASEPAAASAAAAAAASPSAAPGSGRRAAGPETIAQRREVATRRQPASE